MRAKYEEYLKKNGGQNAHLIFTKNRQKQKKIQKINSIYGCRPWLEITNLYTLIELLELEYNTRKDYMIQHQDHPKKIEEAYNQLVIIYDYDEYNYFNYVLKNLIRNIKREGTQLQIHIVEITEREINKLEKIA